MKHLRPSTSNKGQNHQRRVLSLPTRQVQSARASVLGGRASVYYRGLDGAHTLSLSSRVRLPVARRGPVAPRASADLLATLADSNDILPAVVERLGNDAIAFFACTVVVVPFFKARGVSPVLGFLAAGVLLQCLQLVEDQKAVSAIGDLGILFLLFEMGLELSIQRIKTLGKYAVGIGLPALALCTAAFSFFELPTNNALGTRILEQWLNAPSNLADIRSVDEALIIGAALSLSSSAFVLQTLQDKGDLGSRFGTATLGILLVQDIAIIPLLVALPVIESSGGSQSLADGGNLQMLATMGLGAAKSLGGLGLQL